MAGENTGQETSEVRSGHAFDVSSLERYLQGKVPGLVPPLTPRQFKIGQSNPTFLLVDGRGQRFVMRKKPGGKLVATAHAIEREFQVLQALKKVDFPVPTVYCLCEDSSVIGTPFYVMEFIVGRILADASLPDLSAKDRVECYQAIVSTLAQLHSIDFRKVGLEAFGRAGDYYKRQIARMDVTSRQQEIPDQVLPLPHIDELLKWYSTHLPEDMVTIVHGDYKFDNVIFHPTENRVIGVLDWEMSTIGHPFSDVANMCLPFYNMEGFPPPMVNVVGIPGVPAIEDLLRQYCREAGRSYPFAGWPFCISFSYFRALEDWQKDISAWSLWYQMAVIFQGIAARAAKGQNSNPMAEMIGQMAEPMAENAFQLLGGSQPVARL